MKDQAATDLSDQMQPAGESWRRYFVVVRIISESADRSQALSLMHA